MAPARVVMLLENNPYPQDTRVRNEAETLADAGLSVTVIAPRAPRQPRRESVRGVRVERFRLRSAAGSRSSYAIEYAIAHARLIAGAVLGLARGARVVHVHGPPDTLFAAAILARLARRAVVYDMHDSGPELLEAKFGRSRALSLALRSAQRLAIASASEVIVTNESQLELVRRRAPGARARCSIVRNGPRRREFRRARPGRGGELTVPRLIYLGALGIQDGVLDLAALLAAPGLERAQLTVVGDGPMRPRLEQRCAALGVGGRVSFTGHVSHARVPALIAAADIGIDPAPGTELNQGSTMIKVLEYMAAERPVVAYALRETGRSAQGAALYAPCGDAQAFAGLVVSLARDEALRARLASAARARAPQLAWERQAAELRSVYRRLCPDRLCPEGAPRGEQTAEPSAKPNPGPREERHSQVRAQAAR